MVVAVLFSIMKIRNRIIKTKMDDSTKIIFPCRPGKKSRGFVTSMQLHVLDFCWYWFGKNIYIRKFLHIFSKNIGSKLTINLSNLYFSYPKSIMPFCQQPCYHHHYCQLIPPPPPLSSWSSSSWSSIIIISLFNITSTRQQMHHHNYCWAETHEKLWYNSSRNNGLNGWE